MQMTMKMKTFVKNLLLMQANKAQCLCLDAIITLMCHYAEMLFAHTIDTLAICVDNNA